MRLVVGWSWSRWLIGFTLLPAASRWRLSVYLGPAVLWLDRNLPLPPVSLGPPAHIREAIQRRRSAKSGGGDK
jgi:hypothetical protein